MRSDRFNACHPHSHVHGWTFYLFQSFWLVLLFHINPDTACFTHGIKPPNYRDG